jgi:predicted Rossmann-fold nucleotide-binding protein
MPGGMGTMDEFFETLTLIQTGIIKDFPVVVMGKKYFEPLSEMLQKMLASGTISEKDLTLVLFTDDIEEANRYIQEYVIKNYHVSRVNPSLILRERILRR